MHPFIMKGSTESMKSTGSMERLLYKGRIINVMHILLSMQGKDTIALPSS